MKTELIQRKLSRRDLLRVGAGALLTAGLWPLTVRGQEKRSSFSFLVVNDLHYYTERCGPFLERVVAQMKTAKADLCLICGDLTHHGTAAELTPVKEIFSRLGAPFYPVIGNHDYLKQTDRSGYETVFPDRLNYHFGHKGWQFIGLDTTEGLRATKTKIADATFQWLEETLPKLDRKSPTIIFTHFPMGENMRNRPLNAEAVLERFNDFNLQGVFSGHYHAFTECRRGKTMLLTNRCCSINQVNHDKTKGKGYFLCKAEEGKIVRDFVPMETGAEDTGKAEGH